MLPLLYWTWSVLSRSDLAVALVKLWSFTSASTRVPLTGHDGDWTQVHLHAKHICNTELRPCSCNTSVVYWIRRVVKPCLPCLAQTSSSSPWSRQDAVFHFTIHLKTFKMAHTNPTIELWLFLEGHPKRSLIAHLVDSDFGSSSLHGSPPSYSSHITLKIPQPSRASL